MSKAVLNPEALPVVRSLEELESAVEGAPDARFALVLSYDKDIRTHGTKALASSPLLANVGALTLESCGLEGATVKTLLKSPYLGAVTALDLSDNFFHDPGVKAVAAWPGLTNVTHLHLNGTSVYAKGIKELAASPHTGALIELELAFNNLKGAAIPLLAGAPFASRLQRLSLHANELGDSGIKNLGALVGVTGGLWRVGMGPKGLQALLANPALAGRTTLNVASNPLTDAAIGVVLKLGLPASVRRLDLRGTRLTDAGAVKLDHPDLARLEVLFVQQYVSEPLSDATMEQLRQSPHVGAAIAAGEVQHAAQSAADAR